ncbi:1-acyl-sn-glycerol-3-phosphate acyltransferase [Bordetella holmesii]|nr:acyltransferase [Bordetella holmesii H558]AOB34487.1 acyltransferase [Bordetella holmesii]AUL18504.1 1-acyl-sn-glycerol-3-phosphate acyltransferase [Bordetella holmesii]AUL21819.1 1-acyl-sn-glycerol-3-phosphate acyltransferase [Bordetella holmesii]AUL25140.1 1-acyl-sn-glycerol-3-phosphate acyltransferase [Bordetella holmesii]
MGDTGLKLLRFVLRALLVLPWLLFGLFCVSVVYRALSIARRAALNRFWSRWLMRLCGVRLTIRGEPRMQAAVLWAANHVSWIDIFVVNAVRATSFVAKSEIRRWPVIGSLAAGAGTLFIERTQRHAVHAMGQSIHECFARGDAVGLFPEGTTTEGLDLKPFHASLFEPARADGVDIQPVALRYLHHGKRSGFAAFVGEESLVANLWRVLGATGLAVDVVFLPPVATVREDGTPYTRLELSRLTREAILTQL